MRVVKRGVKNAEKCGRCVLYNRRPHLKNRLQLRAPGKSLGALAGLLAAEVRMNPVEKALEEARLLLIDTSLRNRLLNFKTTKRRTLHVQGTSVKELYSNLVGKERGLRLLPKQHRPEDDSGAENTPEQRARLDVFRVNGSVGSNSNVLPQKSEDAAYFEVPTTMEKDELIGRLSYIYRQTQATIEEQGYTPLYLALNFLKWTESPHALETGRAPLILVPAGIRRIRQNLYEISWTTEDVQANYALKVKLQEQDIKLPDAGTLDTWKSIEDFLIGVKRIVSEIDGWEVEESIYLDFFNFTKIIMYRDLDHKSWPNEELLLDHHLLKLLFDPNHHQDKLSRLSEDEIDTVVDFKARYYVMDADPSQIAVIEDVRTGNNLVVQGPPGTGKSQAIVNIIADTLSQDKTVLFVSEKLAALEVVKKRLDDVKLGDFCLELHSRKANKKQFIEELKGILDLPTFKAVNADARFDELETLKKGLNGYAESIGSPCCSLGKSPFELIREREAVSQYFKTKGREMPLLKLNDADSWSKQKWDAEQSLLQQLTEVFPKGSLENHPFYGCHPTDQGPFFTIEVKALLSDCRRMAASIQRTLDNWAKIYGISLPGSWADSQTTFEAAKAIERSSQFRPVRVEPLVWATPGAQEKARTLIAGLAAQQEQRATLGQKFKPHAFDEAKFESLERKHLLSDNWYMLFHPINHYRLKKDLFSLYKAKPTKDLNAVIADLDQLELCIHSRKAIDVARDDARSLFGNLWSGAQGSCKTLGGFVVWVKEFMDLLQCSILSSKTVELLNSGLPYDELRDQINQFRLQWTNLQEKHHDLIGLLRPDYQKLAGKEAELLPFQELLSIWEGWDSGLELIHEWNLFLEKRKACSDTDAEMIVRLVETGVILPEDVTNCLKGLFAASVLDKVFKDNVYLKHFAVGPHENKVEHFARLDQHLIELNRSRLAQRLREKRYQLPDVPQSESQKFLKKEMGKHKNHKAVRTIFAHAPREILGLKPCIMMSPLSVAQFLQPGEVSFDLVIFDEASQVRSEDALGAIARGKQLVVIGDSKQLPPTNFFDVVMDEGDDDAALIGFGSILDRSEASGFPRTSLKWHYRSEHESLIAVSNREFYGNKLVIYPSPIQRNERLGLHFHRLPQGEYDWGGTRTNRVEATFVAEQAIQHYRDWPTASLGIGTFSIAQSEAVTEEIQRLLGENPDLERYFSSDEKEYCFVKNLETIQGDERDVIFISIGYGFDKDKKFHKNFGPLNQDGGERRLNVLITRARKKSVVFANFLPSDLTVDPMANRGVHALRAFLEYAQTGRLGLKFEKEFESDFERSVCECLRDQGLQVHPQVESVGYRIDLAIPHPSESGGYLLGIECDGRKYHSSRVARVRDRLRQQILEERGWKILRLWSTDWYWQRSSAELRLVTAIQDALDKASRYAASEIDTEPPKVAPTDFEHKSDDRIVVDSDAPASDSGFASANLMGDKESVGTETVTLRVPSLENVLMPLLRYIYLNSGEWTPDDSCHGIEEEYWITVKDGAELETCNSEEFGARIRQGAARLVQKGYLKRDYDGRCEITDAGIGELKNWGLTPDDS